MKRIVTILIAAISLAAVLPALAGRDGQAIERMRQNHRAQVGQIEKLTPDEKCAAKRLVLPLDHGPRAQSTPYLNEKRKASFEAELKACKEAAAKAAAQ